MGMMLRRYHAEETPALAYPDGDPSLDWTKDQLTAWADANAVDLTGAKTKADMLATIQAAGNQPAADGAGDDQPNTSVEGANQADGAGDDN